MVDNFYHVSPLFVLSSRRIILSHLKERKLALIKYSFGTSAQAILI